MADGKGAVIGAWGLGHLKGVWQMQRGRGWEAGGKRAPISSLRPHEQFLHAFLGFAATVPPPAPSPQPGIELALTMMGALPSRSSSSTRPASFQDPRADLGLVRVGLGLSQI